MLILKLALVFCDIDKIFSDYPLGVFSIYESNPPLGLCSIGTIAKLRGWNVKIFDQLLHHHDLNELTESIIEYNPEMVGFACTSLNITTSLTCANKIKQKLHCICFAGGIHITLCTDEIVSNGIFDFLLSGEGEEILDLALSTLEESGINGLRNISKTGIWYNGNNTLKGISILSDIDQPIIDRSLIELNLYSNRGALLSEYPCYSLFSSRGCPFSCKFCSKPFYCRIYRHRKITEVLLEIHELVDKYSAKAVSFREDNFTADEDYLRIFCERMINEFEGKLPWECESRAELSRETLEFMYAAGCRGIWCGIETMVPKWNKWINKNLKKENVLLFYHNCKEIGIKTGALFMFGFPDQTECEIEYDINFALNLPTEFSAFQCMAIFPGSPLSKYYAHNPELCHPITPNVAVALTRGKNYIDMISKEHEINLKIKSNRIK